MIKSSPRQDDVGLTKPGPSRIAERQRLAISGYGMVSTQHCLAARAGVTMLEQDGNAVDAAVEASRMRDDIPHALEQNGFSIDVRDLYSFYFGSVQMVMREGDRLVGVAQTE